jgi:hypothetical protein
MLLLTPVPLSFVLIPLTDAYPFKLTDLVAENARSCPEPRLAPIVLTARSHVRKRLR